ncbi:hypothetical protein DPMN_034347 [Dreissena polymorpha]|uniref:Uncharacterized protein n=1 Tax=Dreissena polymorpha TaxID=45954 RepID=A0A9D4RKU9_DREPO|nr:hypothetical protein DPMN_034347 [Dreissena polymorpha]
MRYWSQGILTLQTEDFLLKRHRLCAEINLPFHPWERKETVFAEEVETAGQLSRARIYV